MATRHPRGHAWPQWRASRRSATTAPCRGERRARPSAQPPIKLHDPVGWALLPVLPITAIVVWFVVHAPRPTSPRGYGTANGPCHGQKFACSTDRKANLHCDGHDRFFVAMTCKGPQGCRVIEDGESISCDYTLADENDPCNVEDSACSTDKQRRLRCNGTKFVVVSTCKGPDGCKLSPDNQGYLLSCDDFVADLNDPCLGDRTACRSDKQATLKCRGGRFVLARRCRGPEGCTATHNVGAGMTAVRCDLGLGEVGDDCDEGVALCSADGRSVLRCQGGRLVIGRRCGRACVVSGHVPGCR